jgi:hypothetical protein
MQKPLIAAFLIVGLTVPVLAEETFYIVLGTYKSEAEAEKAIPSLKEC